MAAFHRASLTFIRLLQLESTHFDENLGDEPFAVYSTMISATILLMRSQKFYRPYGPLNQLKKDTVSSAYYILIEVLQSAFYVSLAEFYAEDHLSRDYS